MLQSFDTFISGAIEFATLSRILFATLTCIDQYRLEEQNLFDSYRRTLEQHRDSIRQPSGGNGGGGGSQAAPVAESAPAFSLFSRKATPTAAASNSCTRRLQFAVDQTD
jgi:hypothetical protein